MLRRVRRRDVRRGAVRQGLLGARRVRASRRVLVRVRMGRSRLLGAAVHVGVQRARRVHIAGSVRVLRRLERRRVRRAHLPEGLQRPRQVREPRRVPLRGGLGWQGLRSAHLRPKLCQRLVRCPLSHQQQQQQQRGRRRGGGAGRLRVLPGMVGKALRPAHVPCDVQGLLHRRRLRLLLAVYARGRLLAALLRLLLLQRPRPLRGPRRRARPQRRPCARGSGGCREALATGVPLPGGLDGTSMRDARVLWAAGLRQPWPLREPGQVCLRAGVEWRALRPCRVSQRMLGPW